MSQNEQLFQPYIDPSTGEVIATTNQNLVLNTKEDAWERASLGQTRAITEEEAIQVERDIHALFHELTGAFAGVRLEKLGSGKVPAISELASDPTILTQLRKNLSVLESLASRIQNSAAFIKLLDALVGKRTWSEVDERSEKSLGKAGFLILQLRVFSVLLTDMRQKLDSQLAKAIDAMSITPDKKYTSSALSRLNNTLAFLIGAPSVLAGGLAATELIAHSIVENAELGNEVSEVLAELKQSPLQDVVDQIQTVNDSLAAALRQDNDPQFSRAELFALTEDAMFQLGITGLDREDIYRALGFEVPADGWFQHTQDRVVADRSRAVEKEAQASEVMVREGTIAWVYDFDDQGNPERFQTTIKQHTLFVYPDLEALRDLFESSFKFNIDDTDGNTDKKYPTVNNGMVPLTTERMSPNGGFALVSIEDIFDVPQPELVDFPEGLKSGKTEMDVPTSASTFLTSESDEPSHSTYFIRSAMRNNQDQVIEKNGRVKVSVTDAKGNRQQRWVERAEAEALGLVTPITFKELLNEERVEIYNKPEDTKVVVKIITDSILWDTVEVVGETFTTVDSDKHGPLARVRFQMRTGGVKTMWMDAASAQALWNEQHLQATSNPAEAASVGQDPWMTRVSKTGEGPRSMESDQEESSISLTEFDTKELRDRAQFNEHAVWFFGYASFPETDGTVMGVGNEFPIVFAEDGTIIIGNANFFDDAGVIGVDRATLISLVERSREDIGDDPSRLVFTVGGGDLSNEVGFHIEVLDEEGNVKRVIAENGEKMVLPPGQILVTSIPGPAQIRELENALGKPFPKGKKFVIIGMNVADGNRQIGQVLTDNGALPVLDMRSYNLLSESQKGDFNASGGLVTPVPPVFVENNNPPDLVNDDEVVDPALMEQAMTRAHEIEATYNLPVDSLTPVMNGRMLTGFNGPDGKLFADALGNPVDPEFGSKALLAEAQRSFEVFAAANGVSSAEGIIISTDNGRTIATTKLDPQNENYVRYYVDENGNWVDADPARTAYMDRVTVTITPEELFALLKKEGAVWSTEYDSFTWVGKDGLTKSCTSGLGENPKLDLETCTSSLLIDVHTNDFEEGVSGLRVRVFMSDANRYSSDLRQGFVAQRERHTFIQQEADAWLAPISETYPQHDKGTTLNVFLTAQNSTGPKGRSDSLIKTYVINNIGAGFTWLDPNNLQIVATAGGEDGPYGYMNWSVNGTHSWLVAAQLALTNSEFDVNTDIRTPGDVMYSMIEGMEGATGNVSFPVGAVIH